MAKVLIVMGSDSDIPVMAEAAAMLKEFKETMARDVAAQDAALQEQLARA